MKTNEQAIKNTGLAVLIGFLIMTAAMLVQRTVVAVKAALTDSSNLRQTADRCAATANDEPHFTGCSSIL
ncbi:hypothetical protein KGO95_02325 [Patescibacteria group bacterium]|nr:hypothetical protein [Patescibacteria group bacterium]